MSAELDEILKGCIEGSPKAQKRLYETYKYRFMGVCLRYTASREQAQDVLQESFIKIITKAGSYNSSGSFEGWMTRIVINTAIKMNQKWDNRKVANDVTEYDRPATGPDAIDRMAHNELLEMVQQLPAGYRTVFNLYVIDGYSHPQIAEMLGISEGTSKSQLSRAKGILAQKVKANRLREKKSLNEHV